MSYKYQLDSTSRKYICPECQQKRFVRYIDSETGQYCDDIFGRCDREVKCGYNKTPGGGGLIVCDYVPKPQKLPFIIPVDTFKKTLSNYNQNNLILFLEKLFGKQKTRSVISLYRVGTSKRWEGATLFWQINSKWKIGQGKIMLFDKETGKRIKEPFSHISSVHKQLNKQDQKPEFCFFGEHLVSLVPDKPIAIIESEKTALIMALIEPDYLWIASGGLSNLAAKRMHIYKSRKIVFYPDLGAYEKWNIKAKKLIQLGYKIKTSTLIEERSTAKDKIEGFDIADYFIQKRIDDLRPAKDLEVMVKKNPALQKLIDTFNLVPVR